MDSPAIVKVLQLGLSEACDVIEYYMNCELRVTGKKDPLAENTLEQLKQLLVNSAYVHEPASQHPLYDA